MPRGSFFATGGLGSKSVQALLGEVGRLEAIELGRFWPHGVTEARGPVGLATRIPGLKRGSARRMAERQILAAHGSGVLTSYEIVDNAALRFHFGTSVKDVVDVPIVAGLGTRYKVRGVDLGGTVVPAQPPYVTRGFHDVLVSGEELRLGTGEAMTREFEAGAAMLRGEDISGGVRALKGRTRGIMGTAIYGGAPDIAGFQKGPLPLDVPGSFLQAGQIQVRRQDPTTGKMIPYLAAEGLKEEYPLGQGILMEEAFGPIVRGRKFLEERGLAGADIVVKPETALESYVSTFKLGEIAPLGKHAASAKQTYQQWSLRPLQVSFEDVGRPRVTTKAWEEVREALGDRTYQVPTGIFYTADPDIERAIAGSQGGAIITKKVAKRLGFDYFDPQKGRWIPERAGVGSAVITGMGDKLTVSAVAARVLGRKDIGVITHTARLGKYPNAVRKAIISGLLEQIGDIPGFTHNIRGGLGAVTRHKQQFLQDLTKALGHGASLDIRVRHATRGGMITPQLRLGGGAAFDVERLVGGDISSPQLTAIEGLVKQYNRGLATIKKSEIRSAGGGWAPLQAGFQEEQIQISTGAGKTKAITGLRISDWVGARAGQEIMAKTGAWGMGAPVPGVSGVTYSPKRGRGMKVRWRDVTNLRLYGSKQADAVADLLETVITESQIEHKKEIWQAFLPLYGSRKMPRGIKADTLSETLGPLQAVRGALREGPGKGGYTAEMLAGTIADPTSLYSKGFTLDLAKAARLPPEITAFQGDVRLKQVRIPSMAAMGFGAKGVVGAGDIYYLQPQQKAAQALAFAAGRGKKDLQEEVVTFLQELAHYQVGKTGALRSMIEPRVGQSAYLRLVAQGTGGYAPLLGTQLVAPTGFTLAGGQRYPAEAIARISERDVKAMGAAALQEFRTTGPYAPKGYAWVNATRYPAQGPAHYSMVLAQMVRRAEREQLGPGMLGVSNAFAVRQLGDFDADTAMLTMFTGKEGQKLSRAFAEKHTIPEIVAVADALDTLPAKEKLLLEKGLFPAGPDPRNLSYRQFLERLTSEEVTAKIAESEGMALHKAAEFYGTKLTTGASHKWMEEMRFFAQFSTEKSARRAVGAVLSATHEYAAMLKGGQVESSAQDLIRVSNALSMSALHEGAFQQKEIDTVKKAILGLKEISTGKKHHEMLSEGLEDIDAVVKGFLHAARARKREELPSLAVLATARAKGKTPAESMQILAKALESHMSLTAGASDKVAAATAKAIARTAGLEQGMTEMVEGTALAPITRHAGVDAAVKTIQAGGDIGKELPTPMIDSLIGWFKNPHTAAWKKAGIITGTALLGGAIVKNAFFPGYGPSDELDAVPVHTAVPVPVRMPGLEPSPALTMFDQIPDMRAPVDGSSLMAPMRVNMGTRTPMPAVQMGRGTMVPGYAPNLAGTMFRDPPPAPMVLNQDRYNDRPMGVTYPEQARVGAPPESMASSYRIWATPPAGRLMEQEFMRRTGVQAMVMMEQAEESEYGIRSAIDELGESSFL